MCNKSAKLMCCRGLSLVRSKIQFQDIVQSCINLYKVSNVCIHVYLTLIQYNHCDMCCQLNYMFR